MTIDPARFVAAALQARVAAQGAQKGLSRKPTPSAGGLAGTVTQRVQAIPADDPQRSQHEDEFLCALDLLKVEVFEDVHAGLDEQNPVHR